MTTRGERVDGLVRLALTGTAVVVLLFVLSRLIPKGSSLEELQRYLHMGREGNLPTWWTAGLLLGIALFAALSAWGEPKGVARSWTAVAVTAALLSLDEATRLHERMDRITAGLGISVPTYAWVLPGVVVLALVAATLFLVARSLPRQVTRGLLIAAGVFFLGALGVESLYGATARDAASVIQVSLVLLEETLEAVGATIAFCVVSHHVIGRLRVPAGAAAPRVRLPGPDATASTAATAPTADPAPATRASRVSRAS
ncbi:hypothetical protein GCM10023168_22940 [Fodinibacter luteus]|uniref:Uncharacterized protein n=1 Tax=Fodinibacter luteus TaxID=552064 RepID=A0ABP8KIH2_9MICO